MYINTQDEAVRVPFAAYVERYENSPGRLSPRPSLPGESHQRTGQHHGAEVLELVRSSVMKL
jgi:hypothetical protein